MPGDSPNLSKVLVEYWFLPLSDKKLQNDELEFILKSLNVDVSQLSSSFIWKQ